MQEKLLITGICAYKDCMIFEHKSCRNYLKEVLAERILSNPNYSLRAFSRDLSLSPGFLSSVLSGSRRLSSEMGNKVADNLKLNSKEKEYFIATIALESEKHPLKRERILDEMASLRGKEKLHDLSIDAFKAISDSLHFSILALLDLEGFDPTIDNISKKLGVSGVVIESALERLLRLELIYKNKRGLLKKNHDMVMFKTEQTNEALRNFYKQTLNRAIQSIDKHDLDQRYMSSRTIAVDPESLDEAKQIARKAMDDISNLFEQGKNKSEVFHVGLQIFNFL